MKKFTLITVLILNMVTSFLYAQETKEVTKENSWKFKGMAGINASQTSLVNWSSGGENTIALNAFFNGTASYKKNKLIWDNDLGLEYGNTYTKKNDWVKSVDKIELASKLGYLISKKWSLSGLADFKTQFDKGYKDPKDEQYISKFFAPAYLNLGLGFDYKPFENLSLFLSPITAKMTFVKDNFLSDARAFGVDKGKKLRTEAGSFIKGKYSRSLMENVTLITNIDLFTPYSKDFGKIDVNWETAIAMKVNKYIAANIHTNLRYDNDIKTLDEKGIETGGAKVQFKEMIGVGLSYNF